MGGGGKAHNSVFDIPTLACCKGPRTQVLLPPFPLGRKCGHGISPSPEPTGSGLQSSASKVKTYPVPLLQGILRMAPEILIFISSGRLQHLLFHNSSTSENCAADFCELNFILTVVMLLKMWPFASSFASFTHLELLESKPGWPATKVETLNSQISNKLSSGWGCARMQRHAVRSGGGVRGRRCGSGTVLLVRHSGVSGDINVVCAWVCPGTVSGVGVQIPSSKTFVCLLHLSLVPFIFKI